MRNPPGDARTLASFDETLVHLHKPGKIAGTSECGQTGVMTAKKHPTCPLCAEVAIRRHTDAAERRRASRARLAKRRKAERERQKKPNRERRREIRLCDEEVDALRLLAFEHDNGSVTNLIRRVVKGYLHERSGEVARLRAIAAPALEAARSLAIESTGIQPDSRAVRHSNRLRDLLRRVLRDNT